MNPDQVSSEIKRIDRMLSQQTTEDEKWETFKNYFSEVHNNFDQQLKAVAADISENDIRLASFLRMNMTTKEISSMLNVQPESVMKSKYRLKKKLGLSKEQDLNVFLETLTEQVVLS
jgi:DNA-binding NarL/FixJ family response regulator